MERLTSKYFHDFSPEIKARAVAMLRQRIKLYKDFRLTR